MNKTGARVHRFFRRNSCYSREPGRNPKGSGIKVPLNPACSGRPGGRWGWSLEGSPSSRRPVPEPWSFLGRPRTVVHDGRDRGQSCGPWWKSRKITELHNFGVLGAAWAARWKCRARRWWPECGTARKVDPEQPVATRQLGGCQAYASILRVRTGPLNGRHWWDFGMRVWLEVKGSTNAEASVRGAASKLSSPSEPVSYGLVQFKCCVQCWLIIVYESRLLFVCLQYYCLKHTDYKSKLYSGLNNEI